ncbi:MAG TPA: hypothetical protein VGI76_08320 [Solirubrobacteraceae bacterium]
MRALRHAAAAARRAEGWLWTGPVGHLVGGGLDLAQALLRYYRSRPRRACVRARGGAAEKRTATR